VTAQPPDPARLGLAPDTTSAVGSCPLASQLRTLLRELTHAAGPVTGEPGRARAERKPKAGPRSGPCPDLSRVLT
jgi:hypothetical protein